MALLTVQLIDPTGYGRILRNNGSVTAIVEQKDATAEQLAITEVNTGVLALRTDDLKRWLPQVGNDNAQGEYYLTDLIAIARENGVAVVTKHPHSTAEVEGVNNRIQLSTLERVYQQQQAEKLMVAGVTLADPNRIDIRGNLETGADNFIDCNVIFEGEVRLGSNVHIGPNCQIINSTIGNGVEIKANSVLEQAVVGDSAVIGPFARLRPGTDLAELTKVGNFVETKNTRVGKGSKINHLSYVGDAILGESVNVGAGTITCNYDGVNKHKTIINDNGFIGSNSSLVAPVVIGKNATVGAGSTITRDIPDDELALTRSSQRIVIGWKRPTKKD
jgi:bifunctional UDP-N-acetylglucosamine pyrophosphorylase/glucosamine-1-phosphate N-acetyltransferase